MTDRLAHRGPDGRGTFFRDGIALGHRRLGVRKEQQPLPNENSRLWIVFDGEIYNAESLYRDLLAHGHYFQTENPHENPAEILLHLFEEDGPDMLHKLNGQFALAIWDEKKRSLFLARDRIGKKPLFYRHENDRMLFASELKSLLTVPGIPHEIDPVALNDFVTYGYVPHPSSIFKGFAKLPPGHFAIWNDGVGNDFVCLEPMSWMTDAPNVPLAPEITGLRSLAPGAVTEFISRLSVESNKD